MIYKDHKCTYLYAWVDTSLGRTRDKTPNKKMKITNPVYLKDIIHIWNCPTNSGRTLTASVHGKKSVPGKEGKNPPGRGLSVESRTRTLVGTERATGSCHPRYARSSTISHLIQLGWYHARPSPLLESTFFLTNLSFSKTYFEISPCKKLKKKKGRGLSVHGAEAL